MDINQLKYFIDIVESNFNISETSKKIHISQPALSKMILNFERDENIQLFERSNGRLQNLTPVGENFYYNAVELIKQYNEMMEVLRETSVKMRGKIRIGIPPLVNTILFTEILPKLILDNPSIQFEIIETGAFQLQKSLILNEIDIAVLLRPTNFKKNNVQEILIANDNLCAFMNKGHRLAINKTLSWNDLQNESMAIFDDSFMIHHYLMYKFEKESIKPDIKIRSHNWDYLINAVENPNLITILPSPVSKFCSSESLVEVKFRDPINWEVILCRQNKHHYTRIENFIFHYICNHFDKNKLLKNKLIL